LTTNKLYDIVLQNALIKLLADHYTLDYCSTRLFCKLLYLSFMQVPVSIKNKKLRPKTIKK